MGDHVGRVRRNWRVVAGLVAVVALGVWVSISINQLGSELRQSREDSEVLAEQVEDLGGVPLVSPSPGPAGERGEVGQKGDPGRAPTAVEISAAVSDYLSRHPPASGRAPTTQEILTAVAGYLAEHPPSAGVKGDRGEPGVVGSAGPRGEPGESVTGPPGRDGVDGKPGQDGKDSTVPGPQGEVGPTGPSPSGWTFSWLGTTFTCSPTEPGSTKYECTPQ